MIVLLLFCIGISLSSSNPCSKEQSLNITNGVQYENGSIIFDGMEYTSSSWFEEEIDGIYTQFGCPCTGRVCLWKCCNTGMMYLNTTCSTVDRIEVDPFNPPVFKGHAKSNVIANQHFFYISGLACDKYLVDSNTPGEEIYIQENGTLFELARNLPQWHTPGRYCVDMMLDDSSPTSRLVAGVCYPDTVTTDDSAGLYVAYGVGLMLSVPFLLATFLVYAFIPELRNLHGMCLMAYCGGLIVAYPFLAYLKLVTGKIGVAMIRCYVIAFIVYYAFQTSFFWLNVMCFDIWRTFRRIAPSTQSDWHHPIGSLASQPSHSGYRSSSNKRREHRRFALYGAYAWGVPLLLTACTVGMQFGGFPENVIIPGFGSRRCWFVNWLSELVYFFTPVFVLVVCNSVFFSITAYRIRSIKQETAILKGAESSRSDKLKKDKQRYGLYLKLFVVMGVNWTIEVISFAVGGSNWYWIVVDLSNIALGVYIFFIFVWKNKVRNLIRKRWRALRGLRTQETSFAGRSSSAPTEDTRMSADESAMRLKDIH